MSIEHEIRRLGEDLTEGPAAVPAKYLRATVDSYAANALAIDIGADTVLVPRLETYDSSRLPAAGDDVLVLILGGSPIAVGRIVDQPPLEA